MDQKEFYTIPLRCDALLDQGRYIGPDPVGHKCSGEAHYELYKDGPLLCDQCKMLWDDPNERQRLMFHEPYGRAFQEEYIKERIKNFAKDFGRLE